MAKLDALEKHNSKVRKELEQHISQIQKSIAKYDNAYAKDMDVLSSISESLLNILKNVSTVPQPCSLLFVTLFTLAFERFHVQPFSFRLLWTEWPWISSLYLRALLIETSMNSLDFWKLESTS